MLCVYVGKSQLGRGLCKCKGPEARDARMLRGHFRREVRGWSELEVSKTAGPTESLGFPSKRGGVGGVGVGLGRVLGQRGMWPDSCFKWWSCLGVSPLCPLHVHVGPRVNLDPQMEENRPDAQAGLQMAV